MTGNTQSKVLGDSKSCLGLFAAPLHVQSPGRALDKETGRSREQDLKHSGPGPSGMMQEYN